MKSRVLLFTALAITLSILPAIAADEDTLPPEARAALEAAKKNFEKQGMTMPDVEKMMAENAAEEKEQEKAKAKKLAATKPEPLKELPAWIPPIDGFKPNPGTGKHWIDENGRENGTMSGTVPAGPREAAENFQKVARARFPSVSSNDSTINDKLTMTIYVSNVEAGEKEQKIELKLTPAKGGKSSDAILTYIHPAVSSDAPEAK
jgi:hypothetical protein